MPFQKYVSLKYRLTTKFTQESHMLLSIYNGCLKIMIALNYIVWACKDTTQLLLIM